MSSSRPRSPAEAITRHELSNGLTVYHQRAPSTSVTFAITWTSDAGSARDPPGREGIAAASSRLLQAGTRRRSKRDFARELDRLASAFSARTSWERLEVEVSGPQDAEERGLSLLQEALLEPRFDPEELARVRREMQEALLREESQPDEKADRVFLEKLLPKGHPYRRNPLGTSRSLASMDAERARAFHRSHLFARGSKLIVTSHDPPGTCLSRVRRMLGDLPPGRPAAPLLAPPSSVRGGREPLYLAVPGTTQVEVVIGGTAPARAHPDHAALTLADQVLGGRPILSRLFQVVREQHGFAYGAGSELESLAWGGLWTADAGTDAGHVRQVHQLLVQEVRRLAERGPSPSELRLIRESFLGSLPLLLETSTQAHGLAAEIAYFDLPLDHFVRWPAVLREVKPRQISDAARKHLWDGGPPLAVAVGPPLTRPERSPRGRGRAAH
jgi:zinc protease